MSAAYFSLHLHTLRLPTVVGRNKDAALLMSRPAFLAIMILSAITDITRFAYIQDFMLTILLFCTNDVST